MLETPEGRRKGEHMERFSKPWIENSPMGVLKKNPTGLETRNDNNNGNERCERPGVRPLEAAEAQPTGS